MAEQWFQEKFSNLQIDDNRLNGLSQIHEKLQALNNEEIANVFQFIPFKSNLQMVFACIESTNSRCV